MASQYSHVCFKCGYSTVNTTPSYTTCPACGGTTRNVHCNLEGNQTLYRHRCNSCGWSCPPTFYGSTKCPSCDSELVKSERVNFNSSSPSSSSFTTNGGNSYYRSDSKEGGFLFAIILAIAAVSFLAFWLMMPAWIIVWLVSSFIDFSVFGAWTTAILLTIPLIWLIYNKSAKNPELKSIGWWVPLVVYAIIDLGIVILLGILTLFFGLDSYWGFLDQFKWW